VVLVRSRRFYVVDIILNGRYILYVFVIVSRFKVNENMFNGFLSAYYEL
jgi:hypothetical protein